MRRDKTSAWIVAICFALAIVGLFVIMATTGCTAYNPALYASYDVLNPTEKVTQNPISTFPDPITGKQLFAVNADFLLWVQELKEEVIKLRKGAK